MLLESENIKSLAEHNYVRKASHLNNYWFSFAKMKLDKYRMNGEDFMMILYSEPESYSNYYTIPYSVLKPILKEEYFSKGKVANRKRWVGTIENHKLKVNNCPIVVDVEKYFETESPAEDSLLRILVQQDVESLIEEFAGAFEGSKKLKLVSVYERDPKLRSIAIEAHGTICKVCNFNFEAVYGIHGRNFIEVHHKKPLSSLVEPSLINPKEDMVVLCSNCHRMIHRRKDTPLTIEELSSILNNLRSSKTENT